MHKSHSHFKGKSAKDHLAEVQASGKGSKTEIHGLEIPGSISAGADSARETALVFALLSVIFIPSLGLFLSLSLALIIWRGGRSAWLGWSRLERLHRVLEQEKWEIEHHRPQEREELKELYAAKGFEGKLLEEVLDVLMNDDNRLLKIMIEEELGYTLESYEHPLKQGLGGAIGAFFAALIGFISLYFFGTKGLIFGSIIVVGIGALISAHYTKNRLVPALVWNIGLFILSLGTLYFLMEFV
jgi:hypothetical protein